MLGRMPLRFVSLVLVIVLPTLVLSQDHIEELGKLLDTRPQLRPDTKKLTSFNGPIKSLQLKQFRVQLADYKHEFDEAAPFEGLEERAHSEADYYFDRNGLLLTRRISNGITSAVDSVVYDNEVPVKVSLYNGTTVHRYIYEHGILAEWSSSLNGFVIERLTVSKDGSDYMSGDHTQLYQSESLRFKARYLSFPDEVTEFSLSDGKDSIRLRYTYFPDSIHVVRYQSGKKEALSMVNAIIIGSQESSEGLILPFISGLGRLLLYTTTYSNGRFHRAYNEHGEMIRYLDDLGRLINLDINGIGHTAWAWDGPTNVLRDNRGMIVNKQWVDVDGIFHEMYYYEYDDYGNPTKILVANKMTSINDHQRRDRVGLEHLYKIEYEYWED